MENLKIIEKHDNDISEIKDTMNDIFVSVKMVAKDQQYMSSKLEIISERLGVLEYDVRDNRNEVQDIKRYEKFKKEFLDTLVKWAKIAGIVVPMLFALATYSAYDWGLNKDRPVYSKDKI